VENGVVSITPDDLSFFDSLVLMVEPMTTSNASLAEDYEQALRDLGPWQPIGNPVDQRFDNGWVYRLGVGVATLNGTRYTAQTVVARHGNQRVRFWELADSDGTFNRYKKVIGNAIASAQDISFKPAAAPSKASAASGAAPAVKANKPDAAFGKGVSGVYVGMERGLSASAGVGTGQQQVFNQSSGRVETSNTGTATTMQTQISDFMEVDVFYPDGSYRRRLPVRGLASDQAWDRQQQKILWGTWQQQGNKIIVTRGAYSTTYTLDHGNTLISDRGRPWVKITSQAGGRLEGIYARDDYRGSGAPRLNLHADGTYQEQGNFLRMIGSAWHLLVPDANAMLGRWNDAQFDRAMSASNGTYTFDNFTLTLRTNDGRTWQINAYVPPGENAAKPKRLVINGRALVRD